MRRLRYALFFLMIVTSNTLGADLLPPDRPIETVIDHYIDARLASSTNKAMGQADDFTLIRRLTLDLVGRIPTPAETNDFVSSKSPMKRELLVDRLMASSAFTRHQANQFDAMISGPGGSSSLREYLTKALDSKKPWDQIFRELLTPDENDTQTKGAADFLKSRISDLDRVTNDVSVTFFGVNVSCAQCHDHPLVSDWKQDHFYGMKSFFARSFDNGGFLAEREFGAVKFKPNKGAEKQAKMMFLTGKSIDPPGLKDPSKDEEKKDRERFEQFKKDKKAPPLPSFSARAKLVEIALQSEESVFFSKSIVNRLWHRFMGLGLVMPLDQMHSENPPSHPELLDWLARDMSSHRYDLRRMIRGIALSKVYSRSSVWTGPSTPAPSIYAISQLKPLTPMQLAFSMRIAVSDPKSFEGKPVDVEKRLESLENSARGFASLIAPPTDDFQIGVSEALLFSNNSRVEKDFLGEGGDRLLGRIKAIQEPEKVIDLLVASAMSRPATVEEKQVLLDYLQRRNDRKDDARRQILWSLISSAEFRFNY